MKAMDRRLKVLVLCLLTAIFSSILSAGAYANEDEGGRAVSGDLDGLVNLALNKPVTIAQPDEVFDKIAGIGAYAKETTDLTKGWMLTDGKYGNLDNWEDTADWFVFYRKLQREVVVDLEEIDTVNSVQIGFGQTNGVGIVPPLNVRYYVSNDGTDYRYIGVAEPDTPLFFADTAGNSMHRKVYKLDKYLDGSSLNVQARFVKLVFVINTFGWADEIEVMGQKGIAEGAVIPPAVHDGLHYDGLPAPGTPESANIEDQFLWYSGPMSEANKAFTDWTKEKALAMLGYLDVQGNIKDWFFDDLLALPVMAMITPSGLDGNGAAKFVTKQDLLAYLDFIFQDETQFGAIDWAAGEINAKLGTNKKVRINMSIPWIISSSDFGDIVGDGSKLSTNFADFADQVADPQSREGKFEMHRLALENKKLAFKWYIDEVIKRFEQAGYKNLTLDSFYWMHERILEAEGEVDAIRSTAEYLKSKNYFFTWIPYIGPSSPYVWRDLGFTAASIQPSFAFNASKKAIFPEMAKLAKKVGASIEIEYDDYRTLAQYLNYGLSLGYMNTSNTYYMAAMPIVDGAYAYSPLDPKKVPDSVAAIRRNVYDRVYEYKKGEYQRRFTASLVMDIADKSKIAATVKLPLADRYVDGALEVVYDAAKVDYSGFTVPSASKAAVTVDTATPGVAKIRFSVADPKDAFFADLMEKRNPLLGAPELVTLNFAKKTGIEDSAVTGRDFVINANGSMTDADGNVYLNFTSSDIVPGTEAERYASASAAVVKAEATFLPADVQAARALVNALPDGMNKALLLKRLGALALPIELVKTSPETSFNLGEEAKVTVKATAKSASSAQMTLIMGLYDKAADKLVSFNAITQAIESGKSVEVTGMIKLPESGQYEVRCFVWDSMEGMNPLAEPILIAVKDKK
ncbi:DUF4855 domain-containing protein [Paenibacillus sp. GCM10027626]|uniref:DUF4855 domain-containing protein n=1 Tax=Paenibacillus sp. GCM10027626 TaxID=3273411 RepID=UPI00363BBEC9